MKSQPKKSKQRFASIRVTKRDPPLALGINERGEEVMVFNGDLSQGPSIEYVEIKTSHSYLYGEIHQTFGNKIILEDLQLNYKDHLIPTRLLSVTHRHHMFLLQDKWVFAEKKINSVCDYLLENHHLWTQAELALSYTRSIAFSAVRYGITFRKALEKINNGLVKTRLYVPREKQDHFHGAVAEMLVYTSLDNNGSFTIECWQGVADGGPVFYMHGIMNTERTLFIHFDGAVIQFDPADKERLFMEDIKIKAGDYKKLFKLNGTIQLQEVYDIVARFFPLDGLIDEYFEMSAVPDQ